MTTYVITDPRTGREIEIDANREPTQAEVAKIFAENPEAPAEPAKPGIMSRIGSAMGFGDKESGQNLSDLVAQSAPTAQQQTAPLPGETVEAFVGAIQRSSPYPFPNWAAKALLTRGGKLGDTAAQVIPSIAGTMVGATGGLPGVAAGGGIGSAAGNTLAQLRRNIRGEQQGINAGELAANTITGAVPIGKLKAGMGVGNALLTRAMQGGALGSTQEGIRQVIDDGKIDWGQIGVNGALGVGLGLVLGVPEAIALRKALGGSAPLEGKTLKEAVDTIAAETKLPPETIQQRINDLTLNGPPSTAREAAEVFQKQPMVKDAQESAEAILAEEAAREARQQAFMLAKAEEAITQAREASIAAAPEVRGASPKLNNAPKPQQRQPGLSPQAQRMMDEYGGVNPAALMPVASAAMGGVIGGATGDTPEERLTRALAGMGLGAVSPFAIGTLIKQVKSAPVSKQVAEAATEAFNGLRKFENAHAFIPKEVKNELRFGEQAAAAIDYAGQSLVKDLDTAISNVGGVNAQGVTAVTVRKFLNREIDIGQVPAPVQAQAQKVRTFIDDLTDRAIKEGIVEGKLATTLEANKGEYLRRSYEAYLNPNFKFKPEKIEAAINEVASANNIPRDKAEAIVYATMDRTKMPTYLTGGMIGGRDISSIIKRKDLLPSIKDLLGEVHDPVIAASQTIPRMARLIEMDHAQKRAKEVGEQLGLWSTKQSAQHPRPMVGGQSETHPWLAGYFAGPDVAEAMHRESRSGRLNGIQDLAWKGLTSLTSVAKVGKTVLNPISYSTNLIGGIWSNAAAGNFRVSSVKDGLILGAEELGLLRQFYPNAPKRDALKAELMELRKAGVIGESVIGKDLENTLNSSFWNKLKDPATKTVRAASRAYSGIDDFTRYLAYKSEFANYAKALPGQSAEQISRIAGEAVRSHMPTLSEVPRLMRNLSMAGISPQFVSYTYEMFRTNFNIVKTGLRDVKIGTETGNAALRNLGLRRLASFTVATTAAGSFGAAAMSRNENGIDDETDKAIRYFAAPWDREGVLLHLSKVQPGKPIEFSNLSYTMPSAILWEAVEAAKRGEDEADALASFGKALFSQFLGNPAKESIVIGAAITQMTGRDAVTDRVIKKTATEPTQMDRLRHNFDKAFKPAFVDFAEQTRKAVAGEEGSHGRVYTLEEQRNRLLGVRQTSYLPSKAVQFKAFELGGKLRDAGSIYTNRTSVNKSPEQHAQEYAAAEKARRETFDEIGKAMKHAQKLHVSPEEFAAALRAASVPSVLVAGLLDGGIYTPMPRDQKEPAAAIADALSAAPVDQARAGLAKIYAESPFKAKNVMNAMRGIKRDEVLKVSEYDKLIESMGIGSGERADYIMRKIETLPTTEARKSFYDDLRKKRLITPEVEWQMQNPGKR